MSLHINTLTFSWLGGEKVSLSIWYNCLTSNTALVGRGEEWLLTHDTNYFPPHSSTTFVDFHVWWWRSISGHMLKLRNDHRDSLIVVIQVAETPQIPLSISWRTTTRPALYHPHEATQLGALIHFGVYLVTPYFLFVRHVFSIIQGILSTNANQERWYSFLTDGAKCHYYRKGGKFSCIQSVTFLTFTGGGEERPLNLSTSPLSPLTDTSIFSSGSSLISLLLSFPAPTCAALLPTTLSEMTQWHRLAKRSRKVAYIKAWKTVCAMSLLLEQFIWKYTTRALSKARWKDIERKEKKRTVPTGIHKR